MIAMFTTSIIKLLLLHWLKIIDEQNYYHQFVKWSEFVIHKVLGKIFSQVLCCDFLVLQFQVINMDAITQTP